MKFESAPGIKVHSEREAYSEPCQATAIELFAKTGNG